MNKSVEEIINKAIKILPTILNTIVTNIDVSSIMFFKFRIKSIDSYIKRMTRLNLNIDEVDDLIGFCIVTENIENCYALLNQIRNIQEIEILKEKDFIKSPCGINSYQAIHVKFKYMDVLGEIQIKTIDMNNNAENTYSLYKNN